MAKDPLFEFTATRDTFVGGTFLAKKGTVELTERAARYQPALKKGKKVTAEMPAADPKAEAKS